MRLDDYLRRVGLGGAAPSLRPGADTLRRLHRAHRETFLFENLTIQCGGAVSLAPGDLERKFLDEGRGGYCFEHNTLFAAALRDLGFDPVTLLGRVRRGPPERWCRTHMVLAVPADSRTWLADVGFGATGIVEPIPLEHGALAVQHGFQYALHRDSRLWVLSMRDAGGAVQDLYEFSDDPQTPWDVEVANHFTSTHPESVFRRTVTVQRCGRDERIVLRNDVLERYRDGRVEQSTIERAAWPRLVRELFGIDLPDGPFVCESQPAMPPAGAAGRERTADGRAPSAASVVQ
jgi:N-hydroxyarylamine O-acetyltransferase